MEESRGKVIDIHSRKSAIVEDIWKQELSTDISKQAAEIITDKASKSTALSSDEAKYYQTTHEAHNAAIKRVDDFRMKATELNEHCSKIVKRASQRDKSFKKLQVKLNKVTPGIEGVALEAQKVYDAVLHTQTPMVFNKATEIAEIRGNIEKVRLFSAAMAEFVFQNVAAELDGKKNREKEMLLLSTHKVKEIEMFTTQKAAHMAKANKVNAALQSVQQQLELQRKSNEQKSEYVRTNENKVKKLMHDMEVIPSLIGDVDPETRNSRLREEVSKKSMAQADLLKQIEQVTEENRKTSELMEKSRQKAKDHLDNMLSTFNVSRQKIQAELAKKQESKLELLSTYQRKDVIVSELSASAQRLEILKTIVKRLDGEIEQDKKTIADCKKEIKVLSPNTYQGPPDTDDVYRNLKATETRVEKVTNEIAALKEQIRAVEELRQVSEAEFEIKQAEIIAKMDNKEREIAALDAANRQRKRKHSASNYDQPSYNSNNNSGSDETMSTNMNDDFNLTLDFEPPVTSTPYVTRKRSNNHKSTPPVVRGNSGPKRGRGSRGKNRGK